MQTTSFTIAADKLILEMVREGNAHRTADFIVFQTRISKSGAQLWTVNGKRSGIANVRAVLAYALAADAAAAEKAAADVIDVEVLQGGGEWMGNPWEKHASVEAAIERANDITAKNYTATRVVVNGKVVHTSVHRYPDIAYPGEHCKAAREVLGLGLHAAHVEAFKAAEPELPTTAAGIIANFEAQIVDLRAALATASPDAWVLEIQGLYVRIDGHGKCHACGVLQADQYSAFEAKMRAPQVRNGNDIASTVRSLPEAIDLSIKGLETCIHSIRSIAA